MYVLYLLPCCSWATARNIFSSEVLINIFKYLPYFHNELILPTSMTSEYKVLILFCEIAWVRMWDTKYMKIDVVHFLFEVGENLIFPTQFQVWLQINQNAGSPISVSYSTHLKLFAKLIAVYIDA